MIENLWLFIFLAIIAEVLGTIGGFGSSLFFVPLASYFLDFQSVLGITALFHVMSNLNKIALFKNGFDKKVVLYLGIPAVLFVMIGAYLSKFIQPKYLELALSIFLILISIILFLYKDRTIQATKTNTILGGIFSGILAGLLGTGGAIRGAILSSYNMKMAVFISTSAMIDLAIDATRAIVYFSNGYMHKKYLYLLPILFVVSIIGNFIGKKILTKISEVQFKIIVLILIFITGIITLYKSIIP
jgi:uncharacterized membrane protein YfcA